MHQDSDFWSRATASDRAAGGVAEDRPVASGAAPVDSARDAGPWRGVAIGLLLTGAMVWAYGPTLLQLLKTWIREPDYSHGFLVLPLAIALLWVRRDLLPRGPAAPAWTGAGLLLVSVALRGISAKYHLVALDAWSIPVWLAGLLALLRGWKFVWWSLPAIVFLYFMMPLPWSAEHLLSWPLQRVAAGGAAWVLQSLGHPALAQGNTVMIGAQQLDVAGACAGLRMFLGISGAAYLYLFVVRRPWWQKLLLAMTVPLVAVAANVFRVSVIGLVYGGSSPVSDGLWHDVAGWSMIVVAVMLFAALAWWLDRAFVELRPLDQRELLGPAARAQDCS